MVTEDTGLGLGEQQVGEGGETSCTHANPVSFSLIDNVSGIPPSSALCQPSQQFCRFRR